MLNSIKTLKRYSKANLNKYLRKKSFNDDKTFYLHVKFFISNWNFTA